MKLTQSNILHEVPDLQQPISTAYLAEIIQQQANFAVDEAGRFYVYENGVYQPHGEQAVKSLVKLVLREIGRSGNWTSYRTKEVRQYLAVDASSLWERPPLDQINVLNGCLHLATKEFLPHSPSWLSPIQIPVVFNPSATCPAIDGFIQAIFPEDNQAIGYEIAADIVTPDRSCQKAFILNGPGGNGKSTFLSLLTQFVGDKNVIGTSLHDLEKNRFASARLQGKLANICPDLPNEQLVGTSIFKAITGGDRLVGEYKFQSPFEFTPFARLIFSTNHLPSTRDSSPAFWDRWMVIPFTRRFRGTDQEIPRTELDQRLQDPRELSGLLNKVLEVWPQLRQHGFTCSPSMTTALQQYQEEVDPVAGFLSQCVLLDPAGMVTKQAVYEAYCAYAQERDEHPIANGGFWKRSKASSPSWQEVQREIGGKMQRVLMGVRLKGASQD